MKRNIFETEEEWLNHRTGRITGTRLKDLVVKRGNGKKLGFYELIAEKLAIPEEDEDKMARGHRLEKEAIEKFNEIMGKNAIQVDYEIWERDDETSIAISPDGYIEENGLITEAIEVKCRGSAYHIKALLENKIPNDYEEQVLQYFITNDDLKTLYFVMYDPRIAAKPLICFTVNREEVQDKIVEYKILERETLKEIDEIVAMLTF